MKCRWALAALVVAAAAGMNSCAKAKNISSATQSSMWVATSGDQMVRSYTIQLDNGTVSQVGNAIATGVQPQAMAITPDGTTLFIANSGDNTIGIYSVNSDGTLKSQSTLNSPGQLPVALAVDLGGKLLFAADQSSGDIFVYQIGGSTNLTATPVPTPSPATPASPSALAVAPAGGFLYVADKANNTIVVFSYDNNGTLTALTSGNPCGPAGLCVQVGTNPAGLAFSRCAGITNATPTCAHADGNNLFVSNAGSNTVSVFSACIQTSASCPSPNGTLAASGSPVAACCGPTTFMVDPAANFVYVLQAGSAEVGEFTYNPVTQSLTAMSPAAASTGVSPFSGGITANASMQAGNQNWIYVSNAGASSISGFNVTSTGRLGIPGGGPVSVPAQPSAILLR